MANTIDGKQISSQNARKHGCCSERILILANENIEDYKLIEDTWFGAYKPKEEAEIRLVRQLVDADWFHQRASRALAEVEEELYTTGLHIYWTDAQHQALARFTRYQTARANAVTKARKAVEDFRKNRTAEVMKAEKHEVYKEKSKPEPTVEEMIAQLKKDKIEKDRQAAEQNAEQNR